MPSTLYRTIRNIANIDRQSFIAVLSWVSVFSSVENANHFCDSLRTVLDMHAPPSLRKVITHSSSPWFESIRDELFKAKGEMRQAERKWRNTKLTIFKDFYGQAKHKVSKLAHFMMWLFCLDIFFKVFLLFLIGRCTGIYGHKSCFRTVMAKL